MTLLEDFESTLTEDERDYIARFRDIVGQQHYLPAAILWKGKVVPCDLMMSVFWQIHHGDDCIIGKTIINNQEVSTCFSTVPFADENHFETMIFGFPHPPIVGPLRNSSDRVTGRYRTIKRAKAGHEKTVASLQ